MKVLIYIAVVVELPEAQVHGQAAVSEKYGTYRGIQRRNDRAYTTCGTYRAMSTKRASLQRMWEKAAKKVYRSSSEAAGNQQSMSMVT